MVQFTLSFSPEKAIEQARSDIENCGDVVHYYHQFRSEALQEWSGPDLDSMQGSLQALLAGFRDQRDRIRLTALFLAMDHWPQLDEIVIECLRTSLEDPNSVVRGVALVVLRSFYGFIEDSSGLLGTLLWAGFDEEQMAMARKLQRSDRNQALRVKQRRDEWRALIGNSLDEMLRSRGVTEGYLGNQNPDVRYVAFSVMIGDWKPNPQTVTTCTKAASQDPDTRVRKAAIHIVAIYYSGTNDRTIGSLLARIVRDETETFEVRFAAYDGLFAVRGTPTISRPLLNMLPDTFRIPEDVDWEFVNRFGI
jgi:HEAT repeats